MKHLVPSLETCFKLKEAGFSQNTFCFYRQTPIKNWVITTLTSYSFEEHKCVAAPTLGEIEIPKDYCICHLDTQDIEDIGWYSLIVENDYDHYIVLGKRQKDNEVEARAALWLYLNKKTDEELV